MVYGAAALDPEDRAERALAQGDRGVLAQLAQRHAQPDRGGGFALARGCRRDGGNQDQLAVGLALERGEIDRAPLALDLERPRHQDRPLLYPGKVLADAAGERLFIADSNHNRIVVTSMSGEVIQTIGSGIQGDADGIFSQARFNRPQGLALDRTTGGDRLYVADTGSDE